MRILMMNYSLEIGGQEAHVRDLSNHLAGKTHQVTLWTGPGKFGAMLRGVHHKIVPFSDLAPWPYLKLIHPRFRRQISTFYRNFITTVNETEVDLIHCHGVAEVVLTRAARRNIPIPIIYSSHGWAEDLWPWHMRRLGNCDHYVAVSEYTLKKLAEYRIASSKISKIGYGIPHHNPPAATQVDRLRRQILQGNTEGVVVITVARLHQQKGHDILLRSIPAILRKAPGTVFVFVGDGPERERLQTLAARLRISHVVRFLGATLDIYPYLYAADVFCLPSRYEALPLSIPEAYRAGLPVIVSNVGGCSEIVKDGVTGLLVSCGDPTALANSLLAVIEDRLFRTRLSEGAVRLGHHQRFEPDFVHKRIEDVYKAVCSKPLDPPALNGMECFLSLLMLSRVGVDDPAKVR